MRNKKLWIVLSAVLILLAGLGCGGFSLFAPTPTPTPTPTSTPTATPTSTPTPTFTPTPEAPAGATIPEGWTLYEVDDEGYAIALPPNWEQIDIDPETLEASINAVADQNPELAGFLENQAAILTTQNISFFGFDLSKGSAFSDFVTNINIIVQPLEAEITMDFMLAMTVPMLENLFELEQEIDQEIVTLSSGEAGRLQYGFEVAGGNGQVQVIITQYIFIIDQSMYTLTLSTKTDEIQDREPVFEQIANSFHLID